MFKSFRLAAPFCLVLVCVARAQTGDLKTLVGRKAIAQRMPFFVPGTYQPIPNTYAGKTVTIVEVKLSTMYAAMPKLTARQMANLPQASRESIENMRNAFTVIVQFEDGTKADTGAMPVMPSNLSSYLEVAPDADGGATTLANHEAKLEKPVIAHEHNAACPVIIVKATSSNGGLAHALADGLTKSQFERAVEKANAGGNDPHYLDVRMRNSSDNSITAIEAFVIYSDAMGDAGPQTTLLTQNTKDIKPGGEYRGYSVDTAQRSTNGIGDISVYVNRVRYNNNTFWQDNGSHSCSLTTRVK